MDLDRFAGSSEEEDNNESIEDDNENASDDEGRESSCRTPSSVSMTGDHTPHFEQSQDLNVETNSQQHLEANGRQNNQEAKDQIQVQPLSVSGKQSSKRLGINDVDRMIVSLEDADGEGHQFTQMISK